MVDQTNIPSIAQYTQHGMAPTAGSRTPLVVAADCICMCKYTSVIKVNVHVHVIICMIKRHHYIVLLLLLIIISHSKSVQFSVANLVGYLNAGLLITN